MILEIKVEFQSGIPIYEQIAHRVLELIEEGDLKPGEQLPTIRKMAVELGINFNTVARAYRILDQDGVISTQIGRGTFILEEDDQDQSQRGSSDSIEQLTRFYLRKATYLGFEPEEIKICFEKIVQEGEEKQD